MTKNSKRFSIRPQGTVFAGLGMFGMLAMGVSTSGCLMEDGTVDTAAMEQAASVNQSCVLDSKSIVFKYTDGDKFFTAEVADDSLMGHEPVQVSWKAEWTLADGTRGRTPESSLMVANGEYETAEVMVPVSGSGDYRIEISDIKAADCAPLSKTLTFNFLSDSEKDDGQPSVESCSSSQTLRGSSASDVLTGGPQVDYIYGEGSGDTLRGRDCDDRIYGGNGNDDLFGGDGDDYLHGGSDTIFGGDECTGGAGVDQFLDCERINV
ncbi:hypothetical protein [Haliangium ochraceum]|uniref:Hemolysin-type calcium-binding region n=1 Tax=Haliangium ochraceum (strain DSM 14365 / JCM 11303 / SMP-2) TaxID=502025 RepID=D0LR32_HALO1|nr:hypothetical protein [Haliangium ochraceum]ACY15540.1 hypothetical protein Hoch_3034 [Haliangium ochraceum DSM 14365]